MRNQIELKVIPKKTRSLGIEQFYIFADFEFRNIFHDNKLATRLMIVYVSNCPP